MTTIIPWKAIGNATAYIYSLNNGSEQKYRPEYHSTDRSRAGEKLHIQSESSKTGSIYFEDSEYAEITFTTTSEVTVYRIATFADDWDKWYYEYNDNGTVKRVYRLYEGELDREWLFAYEGNNITVTGKNAYTMTLNDQGYVATFVDGSNTYEYTLRREWLHDKS